MLVERDTRGVVAVVEAALERRAAGDDGGERRRADQTLDLTGLTLRVGIGERRTLRAATENLVDAVLDDLRAEPLGLGAIGECGIDLGDHDGDAEEGHRGECRKMLNAKVAKSAKRRDS